MTIHIEAISAFHNNYIWVIHSEQHAIVVDPGDALPVQHYLEKHALQLYAILLTHHHADHIGGVSDLLQWNKQTIQVYGSAAEQHRRIPYITHPCQEGDVLHFFNTLSFQVIDVPGHTNTHLAYYSLIQNSLFCGDTLFGGGCGRLFEGTPEDMFTSLTKLANLPATTNLYCAHEYTLNNLRFAILVEPHNNALHKRLQKTIALRNQHLSTIPSSLACEKETNPFLRCMSPDIIHTLQSLHQLERIDPVAVFAAIRAWKDAY